MASSILRDNSKFQKQPEKSQSTLNNTAAKAGNPKAAFSRSMPSSMSTLGNTKSAATPSKFSENTEHLQEINSIRKAPVGAQIKRVINLLYKVFHPFLTFCFWVEGFVMFFLKILFHFCNLHENEYHWFSVVSLYTQMNYVINLVSLKSQQIKIMWRRCQYSW